MFLTAGFVGVILAVIYGDTPTLGMANVMKDYILLCVVVEVWIIGAGARGGAGLSVRCMHYHVRKGAGSSFDAKATCFPIGG